MLKFRGTRTYFINFSKGNAIPSSSAMWERQTDGWSD